MIKTLKIIGLGILGLIAVGVISQMATKQPFKVELNGVDLRITNVGDEPIQLLETLVNDRPECTPLGYVRVPDNEEQRRLKIQSNPFVHPTPDDLFHLDPGPYGPKTLKVGDQAFRTSRCSAVVKVRLHTDRGDYLYSF